MTRVDRMPSIFLAHGSPYLLDDDVWVAELAAWAKAMPRPTSILMISAHWVDAPIRIGATHTVPLVYDFYGFPDEYYRVKYPSPGAPELGQRVGALLAPEHAVVHAQTRGLDHGAYIPLIAMYPEADVSVLQMSIPTMDPAALLSIGEKLAPLRDEGVLVIGSGFLTHNLRAMSFDGALPPAWAKEFDMWTKDAIARRDRDSLARYKELAPGVRQALPTHEHFVPLFVSLGASSSADEIRFPIEGFAYGSGAKRSVQLG